LSVAVFKKAMLISVYGSKENVRIIHIRSAIAPSAHELTLLITGIGITE
jgi:hypothetical protein